MLPLHTHAQWAGPRRTGVFKVLDSAEATTSEIPRDRCFRIFREAEPISISGDWAGFLAPRPPDQAVEAPVLHSLSIPDVVAAGDVIRVRGDSLVTVLYRRGANANSLFVTERCNSRCLMCSQPPRDEDDNWRLEEINSLVPLIDKDLPVLGITGGEPTLLGAAIGDLLALCGQYLPQTRLHVLTNGRRFADPAFAAMIARAAQNVTWAIPLYADVGAIHDYVVQVRGAFDETLEGIYNLHERGQMLELRIVLHRETVHRLKQFAEYVYRNLPFVGHVAFMGLEPMGYAKVNRDTLWIDPVDYADTLRDAVLYLDVLGLPVSIYNLPLCVIAPEVRRFARQSISDWKNAFVATCEGCAAKGACAGFFASAGPGWVSRRIRPFAVQGEVT